MPKVKQKSSFHSSNSGSGFNKGKPSKTGIASLIACHYCESTDHLTLSCPKKKVTPTANIPGARKEKAKELKVRREEKRKAKEEKLEAERKEKKDMPVEVTSKVRPPHLRKVIRVQKKKYRDPRFDDLSGEYNELQFEARYAFVEELKEKEKQQIKTLIKDEKMDDETKHKAKDLLRRMKQKDLATNVTAEQKVVDRLKAERKANIKQGLAPYFPKRAEKQKLILAEQFKELREQGKLDSYMRSKQKKREQESIKKRPSTCEDAFTNRVAFGSR